MRVATLNLWAGHGSWNKRRDILIAGLRDLCPDLVAFQESVVTEDYDQVVDLLGPDYHVVHQEKGEADDTQPRSPAAGLWEISGRRDLLSPLA
ncbi:endonuclease/exonuclease/phosphatase family protein [Nonomuraea angiospora]|uniref:endonuclease/exonuclease/phosphatase family protein n=1 Tax=Nonomuraea angiospora TaxID=46172 RepID=UPI0029A85BDE|nr:hypothetical protein [Nonomuraea angiospora]MDX3108092.1 hypothetical protein [Nonomuraea angiospora]